MRRDGLSVWLLVWHGASIIDHGHRSWPSRVFDGQCAAVAVSMLVVALTADCVGGERDRKRWYVIQGRFGLGSMAGNGLKFQARRRADRRPFIESGLVEFKMKTEAVLFPVATGQRLVALAVLRFVELGRRTIFNPTLPSATLNLRAGGGRWSEVNTNLQDHNPHSTTSPVSSLGVRCKAIAVKNINEAEALRHSSRKDKDWSDIALSVCSPVVRNRLI